MTHKTKVWPKFLHWWSADRQQAGSAPRQWWNDGCAGADREEPLTGAGALTPGVGPRVISPKRPKTVRCHSGRRLGAVADPPQAASRGWRGADRGQAAPAAARPSEGRDAKKYQAWRGTGSARSVHAAPAQVQKTYAQRVLPPRNPQTLRSGAKTRGFRCAGAQQKAKRGKKRRRRKNVQKCGRSARAAAKIDVTARVPSRFTPGHHEPLRAS